MQTDREAFLEFARGFAVGLGIVALFMLFIATLSRSPSKESESPRFKVVDSWQGCDVVRYTPDSNAKYAYFLDCGR
jgi:hypothetical protein